MLERFKTDAAKLGTFADDFAKALKAENTKSIDLHIEVKKELDAVIDLTRKHVSFGQELLGALEGMQSKLEEHFAGRADALDNLIGEPPALAGSQVIGQEAA